MATFSFFLRSLHHQFQTPLLPRIHTVASAISVRSSSSSGNGGSEHWNAKYRRLLGIGDSPVVLRESEDYWEPPAPGVIKINYGASLPFNFSNAFHLHMFHALARNSSWGILGYTCGDVKIALNEMGRHLYTLRAVGNLMRALREKGLHDGPFVIESDKRFEEIVKCLALGGGGDDGDEEEEEEEELESLLRDSIPEDLENVGKYDILDVGEPEEMIEYLHGMRKSLWDSGITVPMNPFLQPVQIILS